MHRGFISRKILGYGYYDRQAGLNLDILAPARFDDGLIFHDAAPLLTARIRMMLRPGAYDECDAVPLPDTVEGEVRERYAEQLEISDSYWMDDPQVIAMLRLEEVDHLRHPQYPLDVQVGLFVGGGGVELVWACLEGVSGEGYLTGELLNTPYGESEAVAGDLMALDVTEDSEGTLRLYTRGEMVVAKWKMLVRTAFLWYKYPWRFRIGASTEAPGAVPRQFLYLGA